jgi:hypothetical protein
MVVYTIEGGIVYIQEIALRKEINPFECPRLKSRGLDAERIRSTQSNTLRPACRQAGLILSGTCIFPTQKG